MGASRLPVRVRTQTGHQNLLTKHFSTKPQLGVCCRHQLDLAAQRGGQFTISIVGNCQPSKKDKVSP
ncbi:hypothetical protein ES703_92289 [subsurface metagenome]